VAEGAVGAAGEEIDARIADFGEFDVGPVDDFAEEELREDPAGVAEEQLECDVEGLGHGAIKLWVCRGTGNRDCVSRGQAS